MSCVTPGKFLRVTRQNCLPTRVKKNASDLLDHANTLHHSFTWIFGFDAMVGITQSKVFFLSLCHPAVFGLVQKSVVCFETSGCKS